MPIVRLDKKDLPQIIENIERNGGNASELQAVLGDNNKESNVEISDAQLAEMIRQESTVEEGENLICTACGESCSRLTSGVCDKCFYPWAISARSGFLASRRQDGN